MDESVETHLADPRNKDLLANVVRGLRGAQGRRRARRARRAGGGTGRLRHQMVEYFASPALRGAGAARDRQIGKLLGPPCNHSLACISRCAHWHRQRWRAGWPRQERLALLAQAEEIFGQHVVVPRGGFSAVAIPGLQAPRWEDVVASHAAQADRDGKRAMLQRVTELCGDHSDEKSEDRGSRENSAASG